MKTAVLLLVFNRPDTTKDVFESIRKAQPERLYVAADGPRGHVNGERERCNEVRRITTDVDWPCKVMTLFRDGNLGCRIGVSTAIDWFFDNEPDGIILEDDCQPDPSFFEFSEQLLEHYRDNTNVMVISASYFHGEKYKPEYSYFFSIYNHCWGWASWRRAWQLYDRDMENWIDLRKSTWLKELSGGRRDFEEYWRDIFDRSLADVLLLGEFRTNSTSREKFSYKYWV